MDVALARCVDLPEPDVDEPLLVEALRQRGLDAAAASWDDPQFDWNDPALVVVRATWNYYRSPAEFASWCSSVARGTDRLLNPAPVIAWNMHKGYLLELEERGVPIVPTRLVRREDVQSPSSIAGRAGWREVVVKPAVSAGSFNTYRTAAADADSAASGLLPSGDVLVQQYLDSVEGHGERALVWIEGAVTHSVRKSARFTGDVEQVSGAVVPDADEIDLAGRVMRAASALLGAAAADRLLYARIDVARDASGHPCLMELELIEPSLFLLQHPPALERLAEAIVQRVSRER